MLSEEFIAGYISAIGSFMIVRYRSRSVPVFQIKTDINNASLLDEITSTLEMPSRVYKYTHGKQSYALLLVRNRRVLMDKLIPILDNRILGEKAVRYKQWKSLLEQICGRSKISVFQSTVNEQFDSIEKIKPNKQKKTH